MLSKLERARFFLPFDALNGLSAALKEKEVEYDEKIEFIEEGKEELSDKLNLLEIGDLVWIKYYKIKNYREKVGIVKEINVIGQKIVLSKVENEEEKESIHFQDIYDIYRY